MGLPAFRTHQIQGSKVEGIQYMEYANAQTFLLGAVLIFSSGQVVEGGTNPTGIVGVALQNAGSSPGFDVANASVTNTYTGRRQNVSVTRPNDQTIFAGCFTNGSSTPIAPTTADIGVSYGITAYSGIWTVDKAKTAGNARVQIVGFDLDQTPDQVFFKFLAANLA